MTGRFRLRTALRRRTPWMLVDLGLFTRSGRDCGDHEWFRDRDDVCRCYRCRVGVASCTSVLPEPRVARPDLRRPLDP